ncbi:uncharacterized protein LOC142107561 [Mixophyes fleayi]|uniref:uncharacterized protein LOC142107561 n=1 Tax=Mixophyes fleayi TaxID=3061075 RepID=UPI003F4E4175
MKIAIAFLLVALSSCFVSTDAFIPCMGPISKGQADTIGIELLRLVCEYGELKEKEMERSCEKICIVKSIFTIVKLVAGFKRCNVDFVFMQLLECLKMNKENRAKVIEAFRTNNPTIAVDVVVTIDDLFKALHCAMAKIYSHDRFDLVAVLNGQLSSMDPLLGNCRKFVIENTARFCGIKPDLEHFRFVGTLLGTVGKLVTHLTEEVFGVLTGLIGGLPG